MALNKTFMAAPNLAIESDQTNLGEHVITHQVQETVYGFMAIITIMIFVFLAVHLFIRFHYKAKTDYALKELKEKFEKEVKGPSPYSLPHESEVAKPVEILLEPAELAPIIHNAAMHQGGKIENPNNHIVYMDA